MKLPALRSLATLALIVATLCVGLVHGLYPAAIVFFIGGAALTPWSAMLLNPGRLCVTLTATQLLQLQINAFRKRVPILTMMGTDFTGMALRYLQAAIAHIRTLPSASTYVAGSGGYKNGATSARSLLTDVPLTIDQWGTVPIKMEHLYAIQDEINNYQGVLGDAGYVLGKQMVDYMLAKANFQHFSQKSTFAAADCDVDMLIAVGGAMNGKTESNERYMLVNTDVASVLAADSRLINNQYFGTAQGGETIRVWRNAFGFREIREYVDLPTGTDAATVDVTGEADDETFTTVAAALHGLVVGDRVQLAGLTGGTGIAAGFFYVKTVPSTTTFTLSATLGGATSAFSTDITAGTIKRATNLVAFAFESRALALMGGSPPPVTDQLGAQFGIPMNTLVDSMFDAETQTAMGCAKWQEPGTADLYVVPTMLYGGRAGREISAAGGTTCDYAGHLVISA